MNRLRSFLESLASQAPLALKRAQTVRRLEKRVVELEALNQFYEALSGADDFLELLTIIDDYCQQLLETPHVRIYWRGPARGSLQTIVAEKSVDRPGVTESRSITEMPAIIRQAINTASSIKNTDAGGHKWITFPLMVLEGSVGAISVGQPRPKRPFSDKQQQLLAVIADKAGMVLDRWQTHQTVQSRAAKLETLNSITAKLFADLDLTHLLGEILDTAISLLEADAGSLLLVDQATGDLVVQVVRSPDATAKELTGLRLAAGTGFTGRIAQDGKSLICDGIDDGQTELSPLERHGKFSAQSLLGVSLRKGDVVLGVLQILNKRDQPAF